MRNLLFPVIAVAFLAGCGSDPVGGDAGPDAPGVPDAADGTGAGDVPDTTDTTDAADAPPDLPLPPPPEAPTPFGDVNAALEQAGITGSTEDLAFHPDGKRLVLGIPGGLLELDKDGNATTPALTGDALSWPLGIAFDAEGVLWAADGPGKALRRVDPDGRVSTLANEAHNGLKYPNDLAITPAGHVALTDTCLGKVVVFDREGRRVSEVAFDAATEGGPNGIAVDPAGDALWITTENTSLLCADGTDLFAANAGLFRIPLAADGTMGARVTIAPAMGHYGDGVAFDEHGNLYVIVDTMNTEELGLAESAVRVRPAAGGDLQPFLAVTDRVLANLAFGTGDFGSKTMYFAMLAMPLVVPAEARGVVRTDVGVAGAPVIPPAAPGHPPLPPFFEHGLVAPLDDIPCVTKDGLPTNACNHHGSSVAVQPDGTVLSVWYTGQGEYSPDSRLVWARRAPGAHEFAKWEVLFDDADVPEGNPVIAIGDDPDELWLFFISVYGTSWNDGLVRMTRSTDGGKTWGAPVTLREQKNWMTRNQPVRLSNGETVLPCYNETLYVPSWLFTRDGFRTWEEVAMPDESLLLYIGLIQPAVVERKDGSLVALNRNSGGPFQGSALEITSTDWGRTWSEVAANPLPNPGGSMEMTKLAGGAVAAAFNNSRSQRRPVSVALSDDEARTWSATANLVDQCDGGDCGYPTLAEDPTDGSLWVTWTHARRTIGWAHVSRAWVRTKGDPLAPL